MPQSIAIFIEYKLTLSFLLTPIEVPSVIIHNEDVSPILKATRLSVAESLFHIEKSFFLHPSLDKAIFTSPPECFAGQKTKHKLH